MLFDAAAAIAAASSVLLGLPVEWGIPTMILAAASIDDVVAITGFGVALSLAFLRQGYNTNRIELAVRASGVDRRRR